MSKFKVGEEVEIVEVKELDTPNVGTIGKIEEIEPKNFTEYQLERYGENCMYQVRLRNKGLNPFYSKELKLLNVNLNKLKQNYETV